MAYIALILHVNGVPMIIIGIFVYIHIPTLRIVYVLNYWGCLSISSPPFLRIWKGQGYLSCAVSQVERTVTLPHLFLGGWD